MPRRTDSRSDRKNVLRFLKNSPTFFEKRPMFLKNSESFLEISQSFRRKSHINESPKSSSGGDEERGKRVRVFENLL